MKIFNFLKKTKEVVVSVEGPATKLFFSHYAGRDQECFSFIKTLQNNVPIVKIPEHKIFIQVKRAILDHCIHFFVDYKNNKSYLELISDCSCESCDRKLKSYWKFFMKENKEYFNPVLICLSSPNDNFTDYDIRRNSFIFNEMEGVPKNLTSEAISIFLEKEAQVIPKG